MTAQQTKKVAASVTALIVSLVGLLFGKHLGGQTVSQIGGYVTAAVGGIVAAVHAPAIKKRAKARHEKRKARRKARRHQLGPLTMYDSVNVNTIPENARVVAGYASGLYANLLALRRRFRRARVFSIATTPSVDADCLDVERFDATPAQAPAWVRRQHARGVRRPCIYSSLSLMPAIWEHLKAAGINRNDVRLWAADWTGHAHIPDGMDGCQWRSTPGYDESLLLETFFDA